MEKYKCKLCSKAFGNGRALGGHMRSHLVNLPIPPKSREHPPRDQLSDPAESGLSLSSFSSEERESEEKGLEGCYGLRENPRKSFRLVDPEFLDAACVVQDRESETESSRQNPTRQRSKGARRTGKGKPSSTESVTELEQASSVSNTSPEEDVALCLIMLSRDTWSSDESDESRPSQREYKCETCKKVFASFQALGGHRTSHTKTKNPVSVQYIEEEEEKEEESRQRRKVGTTNGDQKLHECPICFRVFGSGQALGGHKRSHFSASSSAATTTTAQNSAKFGDDLIDLNVPAAVEEDEINQPEVSAVSDAEFIKHSLHTLHSH